MKRPIIQFHSVSNSLLLLNTLVALAYLGWWLIPSNRGNSVLYVLLFFGELYHVIMALSFWYTIRPRPARIRIAYDQTFTPLVDIFITVAGEPVEVVAETLAAVRNIDYPAFRTYILNDGFVAKKDNWRDMETLARQTGAVCITRKKAGGAKAGNINHALKLTDGDLIAVFDADMKPVPSFLKATVPYFCKPDTGFVQTPQYYANTDTGPIAATAWEQQEFFFGPIMRGKDGDNAAFICGTNVVIRRKALEQAGGMAEDNIAEDFLTSLFIHQNGWKSIYLPEVLCFGLAPEDLLSYVRQQLRWARGSLEILFSHNPFLKRNLSFKQRIHYLASALYYFNGLIVLIDIIMPLLFLFFHLQPVRTTTTTFALFFIPFMLLSLYTLFIVSEGSLTFRAISFSIASWVLQLTAILSVLTKRKMGFSVTPKTAQTGNFLYLAYPHIIYIILTVIGSARSTILYGLTPSVSTNIVWALFNSILFLPFIEATRNRQYFFVEDRDAIARRENADGRISPLRQSAGTSGRNIKTTGRSYATVYADNNVSVS